MRLVNCEQKNLPFHMCRVKKTRGSTKFSSLFQFCISKVCERLRAKDQIILIATHWPILRKAVLVGWGWEFNNGSIQGIEKEEVQGG